MSSFQLKVLAAVFMVIDHVGLFFFPNVILLRVVGRLSFPLFAWMIANGARHTRDIDAYLWRLFACALISQVPFVVANQIIGMPLWFFDVIFTLFLGLLAIKFIKRTNRKTWWVFITAVCAVAAYAFNTDYGAFGVVCVVLFYLFYGDMKKLAIWQGVLFALQFLVQIFSMRIQFHVFPAGLFYYIEPVGLLSLFFVHAYNSKQGRRSRFFYYFYPLQYLVIALLLWLKK